MFIVKFWFFRHSTPGAFRFPQGRIVTRCHLRHMLCQEEIEVRKALQEKSLNISARNEITKSRADLARRGQISTGGKIAVWRYSNETPNFVTLPFRLCYPN